MSTTEVAFTVTAGFPSTSELNSIWKVSQTLCQTEFVPRALRNRPDATMACVLFGRELGIGPMQALQSVQVIEGKPTAAPELMRALIRRAGHSFRVTERTATSVTVWGRRADDGDEETVTWTVTDAERAGLCQLKDGKVVARSRQGNPLPWESYTRSMLLARATSELARSLFADVISGVSYVPEEMQSLQAPRREPETVEVDNNIRDGYDDEPIEAEVVEDSDAASEAPPAGPTPAQTRRIHALLRDAGLDDGTYRQRLQERYGVQTSKHLTVEQAASLIRALEATVAACADDSGTAA